MVMIQVMLLRVVKPLRLATKCQSVLLVMNVKLNMLRQVKLTLPAQMPLMVVSFIMLLVACRIKLITSPQEVERIITA